MISSGTLKQHSMSTYKQNKHTQRHLVETVRINSIFNTYYYKEIHTPMLMTCVTLTVANQLVHPTIISYLHNNVYMYY